MEETTLYLANPCSVKKLFTIPINKSGKLNMKKVQKMPS